MSNGPSGIEQQHSVASIGSLLGPQNVQVNSDQPGSSNGLSILNRFPSTGHGSLQHGQALGSHHGPNSAFIRTPHTPATPHTPHTAADVGCKLNLKHIALSARNAEYNPKRFAAVIMRIREPRTTALIFSSGKMVCTGAKSEEQARLAARKYARIIQKLGFDAHFKEFKIQNMVGSCDVKFHIRLEGLFLAQGRFATYEPELFPGLIYRMTRPKIVLLVFVSGKIVITGAKVRGEIYEAFKNIYPILKNFQTSGKNPQ